MKYRLVLALAILPAGWAAAQASADLPPDVFAGSHATVEEVRANSERLYDALAGPEGDPIPRDRFVSVDLPSELVPRQPDRQILGRLFSVLDGDGDGVLSRAEWVDRIESDLAFADQNEDGRITLKELANARENLELGEALDLVF